MPTSTDFLARAVLEYVDSAGEDPFVFDVLLGRDDRRIKGNWPLLGVCGQLSGSDELYPVVLRSTGQIDFGSHFEGSDRYWNTNLRAREVQIGELVTFWNSDKSEEWIYRVVKLEPLSTKL